MLEPSRAIGYHIKQIPKGELGEANKIMEEVFELMDAEEQGVKIMQLIELSDCVGAIELYIQKYFPGIELTDLCKMAEVTKRAFVSGART